MGKSTKKKPTKNPKGAGRKKLKDPTVHLNVYPRKSTVEEFGSREEAVQFAVQKLDEEAERRRTEKAKKDISPTLIITDLTI